MIVCEVARMRRWSYALGTSVAAVAAASATPASAQCSPDPALAYGTVNCAGTDDNGLNISTYGTQVTVASDASVKSGTGAGAITFTNVWGSGVTVNGLVDGVDKAGIAVLAGPTTVGPCDPYSGASVGYCPPGSIQINYPSASVAVTVAESGTVTGSNALLIARDASNSSGIVNATVVNAGVMTGTSGPAILNTVTSNSTLSVTNEETGRITGISGATYVNNAGTIESGEGSATAISANGALTLVNTGRIVGSVVSTAASGQNSSIDTRLGTIEGDLLLGAGDDTLRALYDTASGQLSSITGAIDGGAGSDLLLVDFDSDTTIDHALTLPTNFEDLGLTLQNGVIVTLADGFSGSEAIVASGAGTLRNEANLSAEGTVVSQRFYADGDLTFENAGTISSTGLSGDYAVSLQTSRKFSNSGTISSQGAGVLLSPSSFDNSGTIEANGTALSIQLIGAATNSGTIRSIGDTGLSLGGSSYVQFTNSGTIEGANVGANISTHLINTGTISSAGTGVVLSYYGVLDNQAGATITGGAMGVTSEFPSIFNAQVSNAGTINGDVSFGTANMAGFSNNFFYAIEGGVLNGNLTLSGGDYLVTMLENTGEGAFAGITGTVNANGSNLRYEVTNDANVTLSVPAGFASVGYQLHDGAALSLTSDDTIADRLLLAGNGSVDLTADFVVANGSAVATTSAFTTIEDSASDTGLSIVSHGTITATQTDPSSYGFAAVSLSPQHTFSNTGTITVRDTSGATYSSLWAISGGNVVNSGTISAERGTAISGAVSLENSGAISASGIAVSQYQSGSVVNSGSIASTGATAINISYGYSSEIENRSGGTISSKSGATIQADSGYGLSIANETGATITSGAGIAIQSGGGTVRNAGTITGDVNLGWSSYGSFWGEGVYIADGGTIEGDLLFGSGRNLLIETGHGFGVSGEIDGGEGNNTLGHVRKESGTISLGSALPDGFESEFVGALGLDTVVTIQADEGWNGDILVAGNGHIVNQAATSGSLSGYAFSSSSPLLEELFGPLASLRNEAEVQGGISLSINALSNSGVVGSDSLASTAIYQEASSDFSFENSGTVLASEDAHALVIQTSGATEGSFANSGTIRGGDAYMRLTVNTDEATPTFNFSNSGAIGTVKGTHVTLSDYTLEPMSFDLTIDNTGTMTSSGDGSATLDIQSLTAVNLLMTNSGTIRNEGASYEGAYYDVIYLPDYPFVEVTPRPVTMLASAVSLTGGAEKETEVSFVNTGTIEALGAHSTAIYSIGKLDLVNSGTISGTEGLTLDRKDELAISSGRTRIGGAIDMVGDQDNSIVNSGTINGSIVLGGGNDSIVNTGTIKGDIWLGAGDDSFTQLLSAVFEGTADGGEGSDTLTFDITGGGRLDAATFAQFINFENIALTGSGDVEADGVLAFDTVQMARGSSFELAAGAVLQTAGATGLAGTDGSETVTNRGIIMGNVVLGAGEDTFAAYASSSVRGTVEGGAGYDRLAFYLANTDDSRVTLDFTPYAGFEQLAVGSGIGVYQGDIAFDTVAVEGGRLIGAAGSTLAAANGVRVANGATFGSAGRVIGNVTVAGTLSPGASPGTMAIDGNLVLENGSTTVFEMSDAQSDAITVSGTTSIATGSILTLTGERAFSAEDYTLISSEEGISGDFTTIAKSAEVYGFVRRIGNAIVLTNSLLASEGSSAAVTATVGAINATLKDGSGSDAFYAAIPTLADSSGIAHSSALGTLHPEAYASAAQLGIDNGLALAAASRSSLAAPNTGTGFFAIGQGLGAWNNLRGKAAAGTSDASNNLGGFMAGLGYRSGSFTLAVFGGEAYAHQTIAALGARTRSQGSFVGAAAEFAAGGFTLGGALIRDNSSATTSRTLFNEDEVRGHYDLHSLTFSGHAGYGAALGSDGWTLGPDVTLTHVRTERGDALEAGSQAFSLEVAGRTQSATYLSADLRLELTGKARLRPNLEVGVQQRVSGNPIRASAAFAGTGESFTVAGAIREKTFAHVAGGVNWAATEHLALFAQGQMSFNESTSAQTINGGLRLAF